MSVMLNPLEQALVETCDHWLTRQELVLELEPLAEAETIEDAIEFLIQRRLLERLSINSIAYGHNCYRTTALGRRMLHAHRRRLAGRPVSAVRRRLRLV
jgi:hypothetical protein